MAQVLCRAVPINAGGLVSLPKPEVSADAVQSRAEICSEFT